MALPISFLLGLLVVVANRELGGTLPGACTIGDLLLAALLLAVPWLFATLARRSAAKSIVSGRLSVVPPRALLRLSTISIPLVVYGFFEFGAYNDCIDRVAGSSHVMRTLLSIAPLYLAEIPRLVMATMAEGLLEASYDVRDSHPVSRSLLPKWSDGWPVFRLRLGWPLLTLLPAILLGACLDLLQLHRPSYVFVLATAAGMTIATVGFMLLASAVLPYWFRVAFGLRSAMPEPIGTTLRSTASMLGFSPKRVFSLPTGMRSMNAMMVGPLPSGRLLCLTDGLLATLDSLSLTGVLAHEVGHSRMGHPGLLMLLAVIVPLMMLSPLRLLEIEDLDVTMQVTGAVVIMLLFWLSLRGLARRFEYEADVSSVRALGAEPCSRALMTVSRMSVPPTRSVRGRLMSLHPDEKQRLELMRRYEVEPEFRTQFDRNTRRIRRVIALILAVAVLIGGWFWQADWKFERVLVRFYSGDLVAAQNAMDQLSELPKRWRDPLQQVNEQLACALELAPNAREWSAVEDQLVPAAWDRGQLVLLAEGPAAARPWFSLAITAIPEPSPTEYAVYEFCKAAADGDSHLMSELALIVKRRGVPDGLQPVFRDY